MTTTLRDWTGKNHTIETIAIVDNSEYPHDYWFKVEGVIDGQGIMLDTPVSKPNLRSAHFNMVAALDRYLDGRHHPTHYAGKFAHLARK